MLEIKTILLTTDFSQTAMAAFEPALTVAEKFGARILLVHVDEDSTVTWVSEPVGMSVDVQRLRDNQWEASKKRLAELVAKHLVDRVESTFESPRGTAHAEIVGLAEERDVDLIVMATHGRGFVAHAIIGSTTERVLRRAPCPVLIVKQRSKK